MAGFQKYPYPRYLNGHFWVINKNWRRNMFHIGVPLFIFNFAFFRHWSVTAVNYFKSSINFSWRKTSTYYCLIYYIYLP